MRETCPRGSAHLVNGSREIPGAYTPEELPPGAEAPMESPVPRSSVGFAESPAPGLRQHGIPEPASCLPLSSFLHTLTFP